MGTGEQGKYDLEDRLLDYAARIIRLTDALPRSRAASHVADQLLRSGTAPLSNHGEAQAAESPDDFIQEMNRPPRLNVERCMLHCRAQEPQPWLPRPLRSHHSTPPVFQHPDLGTAKDSPGVSL